MRKDRPNSEWEDIPGFDPSKGEYIRLDCDAWLAAHQIRENGEQRGEQNQPSSDETSPDEMYRRIENWVGKRALDCKENVKKYIEDALATLHTLDSSWGKDNLEIDLEALIRQRCQNLQTQANQSIGDLDKQRAEYNEAERDLKKFRQRHRLSRVAEYPTSQVAHWLWVPVAGIIESFASANLLGSVSRGGIIEGWMVAIVLTIVNIMLGIGAGLSWRRTHYDWGFAKFRKLGAYVVGMFCTALALVWNNVAGHVRDIYVLAENTGTLEAPDEAFATAWSTMIEHPLPWESLASAGLALVGVAVFALTAYKAYTADDRFPGYGAKHRKVRDLHGRYQDDLNNERKRLESTRNEANTAIAEIKDRHELDQANQQSVLDRLAMVVDTYRPNLRQYNKDLAYLIAAYRSANLAARKTEPPPFFASLPTIDEEAIEPPNFIDPDLPDWGDIPARAKQGFEQVEAIYAQLQTAYTKLDDIVDDYVEDSR